MDIIAIVVAVLSLIGCIFSAIYSYRGNVKLQYLGTYLNFKIKAYIDFLESLSLCHSSAATVESFSQLRSCAFSLALFAPQDVGALAVSISNDISSHSFDPAKAELISSLMRSELETLASNSGFNAGIIRRTISSLQRTFLK